MCKSNESDRRMDLDVDAIEEIRSAIVWFFEENDVLFLIRIIENIQMRPFMLGERK